MRGCYITFLIIKTNICITIAEQINLLLPTDILTGVGN